MLSRFVRRFRRKNTNSRSANAIVTDAGLVGHYMALARVDPVEVPRVPYEDQIVPARIIDVYDGDTCKAIILFGAEERCKNCNTRFQGFPVILSIRIEGVDTPEIRASGEHKELEKEAAIGVRDCVRRLILNEIVSLKVISWDKYGGRVVGSVYLINPLVDSGLYSLPGTLGEYLLEKKYAKPYDGGRKEPFTPAELESMVADTAEELKRHEENMILEE